MDRSSLASWLGDLLSLGHGFWVLRPTYWLSTQLPSQGTLQGAAGTPRCIEAERHCASPGKARLEGLLPLKDTAAPSLVAVITLLVDVGVISEVTLFLEA